MDQNEFIKRLSELGQVKELTPKTDRNIRMPDEPVDLYRHGQEFEIDRKSNPSLGYEFKLIKEKRPCEDCGKKVEDRVINIQKYSTPVPHWRRRCTACGFTQNPDTGEYDLKQEGIYSWFVRYFIQRDSVNFPDIFKKKDK